MQVKARRGSRDRPARRRLTANRPRVWLTPFAFTLILIGYLSVWLPLAPAGLRLVGFELGEWVKFLPQVRAGELPSRNLFYLPPITLAGLILLWTARWSGSRTQTWVVRALALGCSLLAWPSLDVIRFEATTEWRLRAGLVGLVLLLALGVGLLRRWPRPIAAVSGIIALVGMLLPAWAYWTYRPAIAFWVNAPVGIGLGLWLNVSGHLILLVLALLPFAHQRREK